TPGSSCWTAKLTTTTGPRSATLTVLPRPRGRWAGTTAPERAARKTLGLSRRPRTVADANGGDRGVLDDADVAWLGASASGTTLAMNARIGPSATRASTPGKPGCAHPLPKLVAPTRRNNPSGRSAISGPP